MPDATRFAGARADLGRAVRWNRRQLLGAGGVSLLSGGLLHLLAARAHSARDAGKTARAPKGTARACIILFQIGGPYQCDTFDPKPGAPEDVRGPFRPIATTVPGLRVTEALPLVARQAHRFAVVRSVYH